MLQQHRCSPASQVLRTHLTSCWRSCQHYRLRRSPTVPPGGGHAALPDGSQQDLPVLALGVFTHAQGLRLRRVVQSLACTVTAHVAFPMTLQGRHAKVMISELHGWPACTPCPCYTHDVTIIGVGLGAGMAGWTFPVRLFHPQLQAGSSRRFHCPHFSHFLLFFHFLPPRRRSPSRPRSLRAGSRHRTWLKCCWPGRSTSAAQSCCPRRRGRDRIAVRIQTQKTSCVPVSTPQAVQ